jgi:hypothetical protein
LWIKEKAKNESPIPLVKITIVITSLYAVVVDHIPLCSSQNNRDIEDNHGPKPIVILIIAVIFFARLMFIDIMSM